MPLTALATYFATLAIMGAGLCVAIQPLRKLAWRFLVVGGILAAAAGAAPAFLR